MAIALLCAGCVVVSPTPEAPTASLITATQPPTLLSPASAAAIAIVTATPSVTAPATDTPPPALETATPIASATTPATPTDTPLPPASPPGPTAPPPPTLPPQATARPVAISFFSIAPAQINPGDAVTLTWQATGEQATIYRQDPRGPLTDMQSVPISGTLTLKTPAELRNRVDYVLYASAGGSNASATVSAVIRCPDQWFFANPPAGCPYGPSTLVQMAAEHFEHGLMLWVSSQNYIYMLFGDGGSPHWASVANGWVQGQPESDPSLIPPAGLFQPIRGFGVAWRASDVTLGQVVRDRLGWATDPESALTGGYQCDTAPKYNTCYISGPGGVVYVLKPEFSGWGVWPGP
jgi:hypothetical protein